MRNGIPINASLNMDYTDIEKPEQYVSPEFKIIKETVVEEKNNGIFEEIIYYHKQIVKLGTPIVAFTVKKNVVKVIASAKTMEQILKKCKEIKVKKPLFHIYKVSDFEYLNTKQKLTK